MNDREILLTRAFDAPREVVFQAWIEPDRVAQWWGPRGFTITTHTMDVRPGGEWRFVMHGPDGTDYENRIVYREVVPPERLVYSQGEGVGDPGQFETKVTFTERQGKTTITMRALFVSAAERERVIREVNAVEGGRQTLERLAEYLAGE